MKNKNSESSGKLYLTERSLTLSRILSFVALLFPLLATVGWLLDISLLKQGHTALPAMQPNTAFGLALASFALLLSSDRQRKIAFWSSYLFALVILLLGLFTLIEYVAGLEYRN